VRFVRVLGGWTSETYDIDGAWIVQVARTPYAAETLRHQARVLPLLAPRLPARVPALVIRGDDPVTAVYPRLPGDPAEDAAGTWPEELGRFLRALHAIPPGELGFAGDAATLRAEVRDICAGLAADVCPRLTADERAGAERAIARYLDDDRNWAFTPVVCHNDLGPEHVLVDAAGALAGVIDWEDVSLGDPAWELAWWLYVRPAIGERILAAHGMREDATFRARARFAYMLMPWDQVVYGVAQGDAETIATGLAGVRASLYEGY